MAHRTVIALVALLALPLAAACGEGLLDASADDSVTQEPIVEAPDGAQAQGPEEQGPEEQPQGPEEQPLSADPELARPGEIGAVNDAYYTGRKVLVEEFNELEDAFVYEGDILLPRDMVRFEPVELVLEPGEEPALSDDYAELTARPDALWPDGVVPYAVDPALPDQRRVSDAIAHWEANSNLTFVARTTQSDYVYFQPSTGCSSYLGKIGGKQPIMLASNCSTGNTIHEIGHAVGLWHEHSRVDRDNDVIIKWENIQSGREHNFKTYAEQGFQGEEYTDSLDFGSIMMYGPYSFSRNGQPTIVKADGSTFSIQRNGLSSGDIQGLETLYPAGGGEPEYINGEYYTISGVTVLRYYDRWYYYTRYGWRMVELVDGQWEYV